MAFLIHSKFITRNYATIAIKHCITLLSSYRLGRINEKLGLIQTKCLRKVKRTALVSRKG
jgi:hypothetical protein